MLVGSATILAAPNVPNGAIVATGETVGIVYHAKFEDVGFYGVGFFDTISKKLAAIDRAATLFAELRDRHLTANAIVQNEGVAGEYLPSDAEVQWAKMKPLGVNAELDGTGTGAYFSVTYEAVQNPVFPWIFVGLLALLVSAVLVADDIAHPDLTFNAPEDVSEGFHKLADALSNPEGPVMEFAQGFKIAAVAALVVGGLYFLTRSR
jgi:hypothetical protein